MGVLEWNTVSNTFVNFISNITGYVSATPGDDAVLVLGYDSNINILKPQGEFLRCRTSSVASHVDTSLSHTISE